MQLCDPTCILEAIDRVSSSHKSLGWKRNKWVGVCSTPISLGHIFWEFVDCFVYCLTKKLCDFETYCDTMMLNLIKVRFLGGNPPPGWNPDRCTVCGRAEANTTVVITSFHLLLWLHPRQQHFPQGQYVIITAECMPSPNMMLQHLKAEELYMIVSAYFSTKHPCS